MKLEEKKTTRLQVRVNEIDLQILKFVSSCVGLSVSKYIRMLVNGTLAPVKLSLQKGELKWEDIQTIGEIKEEDENK